MPEYIKLEPLRDEILNDDFDCDITNHFLGVVDSQPTADAVEVIHGRWETGHYEGGIFDGINFEKCNVCQFERLFDDIRFKTTFNYCPNCGAKMDLKEGAEE